MSQKLIKISQKLIKCSGSKSEVLGAAGERNWLTAPPRSSSAGAADEEPSAKGCCRSSALSERGKPAPSGTALWRIPRCHGLSDRLGVASPDPLADAVPRRSESMRPVTVVPFMGFTAPTPWMTWDRLAKSRVTRGKGGESVTSSRLLQTRGERRRCKEGRGTSKGGEWRSLGGECAPGDSNPQPAD